MAGNCIANMPEDVKWKIVNHANISNTKSNGVALSDKLFTLYPPCLDLGRKGNLSQVGRRILLGDIFILIITLFGHICFTTFI